MARLFSLAIALFIMASLFVVVSPATAQQSLPFTDEDSIILEPPESGGATVPIFPTPEPPQPPQPPRPDNPTDPQPPPEPVPPVNDPPPDEKPNPPRY